MIYRAKYHIHKHNKRIQLQNCCVYNTHANSLGDVPATLQPSIGWHLRHSECIADACGDDIILGLFWQYLLILYFIAKVLYVHLYKINMSDWDRKITLSYMYIIQNSSSPALLCFPPQYVYQRLSGSMVLYIAHLQSVASFLIEVVTTMCTCSQ
jgi:hypothetical protein